MNLWPDDHPANTAEEIHFDESPAWMTRVTRRPTIEPYLPERGNGVAVVVMPGGGYAGLSFANEGIPVAEWFQQRGVAAFLLSYRCGGGRNQQPVPLDDARRAMRIVANRADEFDIDPEKIGVIGFSAGGRLASCIATMPHDGDASASDKIERQPARAAFAVLVYPVTSMERTSGNSRKHFLGENPSEQLVEKWTTWKQVDESTPPTFLVHASDDKLVPPSDPIRYYEALQEHNVPAELHIFARGGHGFGLLPGKRSFRHWPEMMQRWLKERGLLKKAE